MSCFRPSACVLAAALLAGGVAIAPQVTFAGELDGLFKRAVDRTKDRLKRQAEDKAVDTLTQPVERAVEGATPRSAGQGGGSGASRTGASAGIAWKPPRADQRIAQVPQHRWMSPGMGRKFSPVEEGRPQIVAVNPYLQPERPFFGAMHGLQCAADGGLVVAAQGGLDAEGGVAGDGWWRIAPDGAITPVVTRPYGQPGGLASGRDFSLASDGSLLMADDGAIVRVAADGRIQRLASGFTNPGAPLQDPAGNIWVADDGGCELKRIAPDGNVSTVIGRDAARCGTRAPEDRVNLDDLAWDPVHGELVSGGGLITGKPTHDMRVTLWRIKPDGQARRVWFTLKAGRSPIGQNTDTIWSLTVDAKGRIVVATRLLNDQARRQIMRLDESRGRLVTLTGQEFAKAFGFHDYRAGHEEAPYDNVAAHASFREARDICYGPDGTLFALDEHLVRRFDTDGQVRTWAY